MLLYCIVYETLIPRDANFQSDLPSSNDVQQNCWEEQCGWMHSPDTLFICHKWTLNSFAYRTTTCVLKETNPEEKRSTSLLVINHFDDITEAFLMCCCKRCHAWVEPSRRNHLTCGRKITGSLKTRISHGKQYFTTISMLKYLRLLHRPVPLPLCCRTLIYHFHYVQVHSQRAFSKLMCCDKRWGEGRGWLMFAG